MKTPAKYLSAIFLIALFIAVFPALTQEDDSIASETGVVESSPSEAPLPNVPPRGKTGTITVHTTPSKARVYMDGDDLGLTPIENKSFRTGRFDFSIMIQGRDLVNERVNIWPDKLTKIEKVLKMPFGSLILTTRPGHTRVFIDDEEVGKTSGGPLTINNLQSGLHFLKVKARGYRSKQTEIEILPEDTTRVDIRMAR